MKRLNRDTIFSSDDLRSNLARKSVRGGMTTMFAQAMRFVLNIIGTVVLARLLTPNDYGLFGMVIVVVGFAEMLKDAGLAMATINKDHITHEQISTLFWLNFLISVILGVCLLASSPLVAIFYQRPELRAVAAALSVSFIISGLVIQHQALLYRHMMFSTLAITQIAAPVINLSVSIPLAYFGCHYWALVGGAISATLAGTFLTCFFCPWVPGWIRKGSGARTMLVFGGHMTVANIANHICMSLDSILIGKFIGPAALGLYAKAYQLFLTPIMQIRNPIVNVALPVLCSLRGQPERYAKYYLRIVDLLATLVIPGALYCVVEADFLIRFFLGQQWIGAVPVFRILAIAGLIYPLNAMQGLVMLSMGFSSRCMYWQLCNAFFYVGAFVAGLPFGIEGVAVGFAIAAYLLCFISLFYCFHNAPVTCFQFVRILVLPFLVSVLAMGGAILVKFSWNDKSISCNLMGLVVFFGIYIGVSCCRKMVRETMGLLFRELYFYPGKNQGLEQIELSKIP